MGGERGSRRNESDREERMARRSKANVDKTVPVDDYETRRK
jgi:hypothetical protein